MSENSIFDKIENSIFWNLLLKIVRAGMIICSIVTTVVIFLGAFMRYVLHTDFYGIDDIILLFAFWLYFLGAVHGSYENSHIKADILMTMMRNIRVKDAVSLVAQLLLVLVNGVLIGWGWEFFWRGIVEMPVTTALHIPYAIPRFAIFLGLALMEFYHVYYFIKNIWLYKNRGHHSVPNEFDYFTKHALKKWPDEGIPSKEEADRMKEAAKSKTEANEMKGVEA